MFALLRWMLRTPKLTCQTHKPWKPRVEALEDRSVPANLIVNGNFEAGNTGFQSDYRYSPGNIGPDTVYDILRDPSQAHHLGISYGDHTSGSGFMMAVNGAIPPNNNASVWSETVTVHSDISYTLSLWVSNPLNHPAPPRLLHFFINGTSIGNTFTPPVAGVWVEYTTSWESGSNQTATINIIAEPDAIGNTAADFALDDIFFHGPDTDIAMSSAYLRDATTVEFTYTTVGNPGPFEAGLYRSADATFDPSDVLLDTQTVSPSPTNPQAPGTFPIPPFAVDPDHPYLLIVADPDDLVQEASNDNNAVALRVGDIEVTSATTLDSRSVTFSYTVTGQPSSLFQASVYRSTDATFDPASDVLLGSQTFDISGPGTFTGVIATPLPIDPTHPYVFVVADPDDIIYELSEDNNSDSFEKRVLGVVTHGLIPLGAFGRGFPSWITEMAADLRNSQHYDRTVTFDWTVLSGLVLSGMTELAGVRLADRTQSEIAQMKARWPDAIFDLHLIGHSRGAVVIGQALQDLQSRAVGADIRKGFTKMTMLDPHPARNTFPLQFSVIDNRLGQSVAATVILVQGIMQDPDAYFPLYTDQAEVFYQRTPAAAARTFPEVILNLWGESNILNLSGTSIATYDLTGLVFGGQRGRPLVVNHGTITDWYSESVIPTL